MRAILAFFVFASCASGSATASGATPAGFSIDWYSIDGGGGVSVSADSSLKLSGSIGQHEPDVVSLCSAEAGAECIDPILQLAGGFWAGVAAAAGGTAPACDGAVGCIFGNGFEAADAATTP